jgi:hypothetical protein
MNSFYLTSAKQPFGIPELCEAIAHLIDWQDLSRTSRPLLFQRIRETIDQKRREGEIVLLYSALEQLFQQSVPNEFNPTSVDIVVGQLARQGAITDTRLSTGERALVLRIGYVEIYAGSLLRIAGDNGRSSGVPVLEISEAIFRKSFPGIPDKERLSPLQERSVLECVIELMIENGLCLKHERLLIFPTLFPETSVDAEADERCKVSLYYDFSGAIGNIYSSLVAQLALSGKFGRVRLWKGRAEFEQPGKGVCGLRRIDRPGGCSHLDLVFSEQTASVTRERFTVFIEEHLQKEGVKIREVLQMDCGKCASASRTNRRIHRRHS